jgi:hypothetical protein
MANVLAIPVQKLRESWPINAPTLARAIVVNRLQGSKPLLSVR